MLRLMFQRHANKHKICKKINDKKVKYTESLLTQFGTNHLHLGATKLGRKSTTVVLILSLSANSSFTTLDLGPTRIDFNLGIPRFEIPSHYSTINHIPCDYQT